MLKQVFIEQSQFSSVQSLSHAITFLTQVHIVKATVFPVVMYGYESWNIKRAKELMLSNCGAGKDSDAGRDWGQEEKGATEDEMAGWHH